MGYESVGGGRSTSAILNKWTVGGVARDSESPKGPYVSVASGALVQDTYKEVLNVTGKGNLNLLYIQSTGGTSQAIGCKIVLDGVTIFDASSADEDNAYYMNILGYGMYASTGYAASLDAITVLTYQNVFFSSSLSISVKSSAASPAVITTYYVVC